jgi:hypothetical protein
MAYTNSKLSRRQVLKLLFAITTAPALAACVNSAVPTPFTPPIQTDTAKHVKQWDEGTLKRHAAFVTLAKQKTSGKKPPLRTVFVGEYEVILPTPLSRQK